MDLFWDRKQTGPEINLQLLSMLVMISRQWETSHYRGSPSPGNLLLTQKHPWELIRNTIYRPIKYQYNMIKRELPLITPLFMSEVPLHHLSEGTVMWGSLLESMKPLSASFHNLTLQQTNQLLLLMTISQVLWWTKVKLKVLGLRT